MVDDNDVRYLRRAVDLAAKALETGEEPFGSVLVSGDGEVLFEDHNRVSGGDETRHPEFEIARWSGTHMTPAERAAATVYTSGEHCPMCAAAHGWEELRRRRRLRAVAHPRFSPRGRWRVTGGPGWAGSCTRSRRPS